MSAPTQEVIDRVVQEKNELNERLTKLRTFLLSEQVKKLDLPDIKLLGEQEYHMSKLLDILDKRLRRFEINQDTKN